MSTSKRYPLVALAVLAILAAGCPAGDAPPPGGDGGSGGGPPRPAAAAQPAWGTVAGGVGRTGRTDDAGPAVAPGILWSTPLAGSPTCDVVRVRVGERDALVVASAAQVYQLDARDGRVVWMHDVGGVVGASPIVMGDELFVPTLDGYVVFLSLEDGSERAAEEWDFPIAGPPLVAGGRVIFEETSFSTRDLRSMLRAWDPAAEAEAWAFEFMGGKAGMLAADDELVYVAADAAVHAVRAADGQLAWSHEFPPQVRVGGPVVQDDLVVIVRGAGYAWTAEALDRRTGAPRWTVRVVGNVATSPALTRTEVLVGTVDGRVARLSLADGSSVGEAKLPSAAEVRPIVAPARVYYGRRHAVGALDRTDWSRLWEVELAGQPLSLVPLGDELGVATDDGFVHVLGAPK